MYLDYVLDQWMTTILLPNLYSWRREELKLGLRSLIRNISDFEFKSNPHHSAIKWWLCKQYVCLKIYIVPLRQFMNLTMYLVLHQNLVRISNQNSNSIKLLSFLLLQTISHWLNFEFYIQGRNFSNILYRGLTGEGTEYLI